MQFKAFEPGIEVLGKALEFTLAGFRIMPSMGMRYLTMHGLTRPGPDGKPTFDRDGWHSQQAWLDAFRAIHDEVGSFTTFEMGRQLSLQGFSPAVPKEMHTAMVWLDMGYHVFHRKNGKVMGDPATGRMVEGIGHYGYKRERDDKIVSVCQNPYPCDFDFGLLSGTAERFEKRARVMHDDSAPCRKKGADSCTYVITW